MSNNNVNFYFIPDPIVKIYLLYNNQRIAKKKTHVKKRTLNPVFNESFLFDIPYNEGLQNISMEFLVMDWDRMTKNEVIGRLEIGGKSSGQELHHWNEVMNCPRKQIAEWHKLREWNGRVRQKKKRGSETECCKARKWERVQGRPKTLLELLYFVISICHNFKHVQ